MTKHRDGPPTTEVRPDRPWPVGEGPQPGKLKPRPEQFYIATTKHGFVGNATVFWCPNGSGYSCDIEDAGLYTREDAESICGERDDQFMIRDDLVVAHQRNYLHADDMRRLVKETKD